MPRFLPRSKKLRTAVIVVGSLVIVGILAAILASTANSGSAKKQVSVKPPAHVKATTKPVTLVIGHVGIENAGPPAKITPSIRRALMKATQQYFNDAIQSPLRNGRVKAAYDNVFDPGVNGPAAGPDRAALTESATGVIRGPVKMLASPVQIDGLGDPTGKLALVATTFTLKVNANTPRGPLTIQRHTELTFANEFGRWLVTAYRVRVRRSIATKTTSTTAHAGPGTTA